MNKLKAIALIIILVVSSVGCCSSKIAVIDPIRLFQESMPGKAGTNHLRSVEEAMQTQVDLAQKLIDKSPKDKKMESHFQKMFMNYQQIINTEQQKVVELVNELIQKTLDSYRLDKGYSVLMSRDSLLSYNPSDDVTDDIITILNCSSIKFEPVILDKLDIDKVEIKKKIRK